MWRHKLKCFELSTTPYINTYTIFQTTVQLVYLHIYYLLSYSLTVKIYMPSIFSLSFQRKTYLCLNQLVGKSENR